MKCEYQTLHQQYLLTYFSFIILIKFIISWWSEEHYLLIESFFVNFQWNHNFVVYPTVKCTILGQFSGHKLWSGHNHSQLWYILGFIFQVLYLSLIYLSIYLSFYLCSRNCLFYFFFIIELIYIFIFLHTYLVFQKIVFLWHRKRRKIQFLELHHNIISIQLSISSTYVFVSVDIHICMYIHIQLWKYTA